MTNFEQATVISNVGGHLRLELPQLYRNPNARPTLEALLSAQAGVLSVRANPVTGRILVSMKDAQAVTQLLQRLPCVPDSAGTRPLGQFATPAAPARPPRKSPPPKPKPRQLQPIYPAWHLRNMEEALAYFGSSASHGLSDEEASRRLTQGRNVLPPPPPVSALALLLNQFRTLPVVLLGASTLLSLLTGALAEAAAIGTVLILNGAIGFATEWRAQRTIASLIPPVALRATVLRAGGQQDIDSADVVPGDILLLRRGAQVVADLRLLQADALLIDEALLTGESYPVQKANAALPRQAALAARSNMAYRGTTVAAGNGRGVVVGTGPRTEAGAIQAASSMAARPRTPSQVQLDELGARLVKVSTTLCLAIFALGLLRGYRPLPMFKIAVSLAIAAVPEGLPTVATTALARGIRRLRAQHVLVRALPAVETLGALHVICLDKTGTLTQNRMTAVAVRTPSKALAAPDLHPGPAPELTRLLQVCALCNQADAGDASHPSGTESALLALDVQCGVDIQALRRDYPLLHMELRTEGRNYMRTRHRMPGGGELLAVKGSPDEVLAMCSAWLDKDRATPLDQAFRNTLKRQNDAMAAQQLRVLGFAYAEQVTGHPPAPLTWIGLVGLADPIREGVEQVIEQFHTAGIRTVMVTGDQAATAHRIGQKLHLSDGKRLHVVSARQMDQLPPPALARLATDTHVFARVTPSDKLRIVHALQASEQVVAMTGDGINDGPALRAADVGIAMGSGSAAALSMAEVALQNDRLDTLLDAIRQGRAISANIRTALHFLVSSNLSEILVVAGAVVLGAGQPLGALQLLWLNLLTDVLPAIALATEPASPDLLRQPPRAPGTPIVGRQQFKRYTLEAAALAGGSLASYLAGRSWYGEGEHASTMAFDALVFGQLLHALVCRSEQRHVPGDLPLPRNRRLMLAIGASAALQGLTVLLPGLRRQLGLSPLNLADLVMTGVGALLPMLLNEWSKPHAPQPAAKVA